jgi:acyl carrier protein
MSGKHLTVSEEVRAAVAAELGCSPELVSDEAGLSELSGLDSLRLFRIINTLEYKCNITLNDEEVYQLRSIKEMVSLIENELAHQSEGSPSPQGL